MSRASRRAFSACAQARNTPSQFPTAYSVRQPAAPRPPTAYSKLDFQPSRRANPVAWNNSQIGMAAMTSTKTPEQKWGEASAQALNKFQNFKISDAYAGRRVWVMDGDFNYALGRLNRILSTNRVRPTLFASQRHEKKGERLRRIKSEQWRKHFAAEVRKKVQLVAAIRRRGA
ncbi:Glycerol-3-phosphate o-acyltransferase [Mycena kentingensis (nom. inval.)]|nr:Glycerol-3-phosphate o-acyltransferase [Mycena kentingensis (nom. inval.)]